MCVSDRSNAPTNNPKSVAVPLADTRGKRLHARNRPQKSLWTLVHWSEKGEPQKGIQP